MPRHPIIRRAVPLAALLAGVLAGPAAAANYCVDAPSCWGTPFNGNLQGALDAAGTSETADTVHIGPGICEGIRRAFGRPSGRFVPSVGTN